MRVPNSLVSTVQELIQRKKTNAFRIPMYLSRVPAGSPSDLEDYVDDYIDLNEFLVSDPDHTFMVIAKGDSMIGANITSGSILIADRSLEPRHGHIVIASVDGEITVKRLHKTLKAIMLKPENPKYDSIKITSKNAFCILGVVTHIVISAIYP